MILGNYSLFDWYITVCFIIGAGITVFLAVCLIAWTYLYISTLVFVVYKYIKCPHPLIKEDAPYIRARIMLIWKCFTSAHFIMRGGRIVIAGQYTIEVNP